MRSKTLTLGLIVGLVVTLNGQALDTTACGTPVSVLLQKRKKLNKLTARYVSKHPIEDVQFVRLHKNSSTGDCQEFQSILSRILTSDWTEDTYKLSAELLELDIPKINGILILGSFSSFYPIDISLISSYCFWGEQQMNPSKSGGLDHLINTCVKGGAEGGWAARYLYQFIGAESLQYMSKLRNDENVFARYTYANILVRLNENDEALPILEEIINQDIEALQQPDSESRSYIYAVWSIELISHFDVALAQKRCKELTDILNETIQNIESKDFRSDIDEAKLLNAPHALHELESMQIENCKSSSDRQ